MTTDTIHWVILILVIISLLLQLVSWGPWRK